jgi:hypothetical protein
MSLDSKKALRRGNISSAGESVFKFIIPLCVVSYAAYYVYNMKSNRRKEFSIKR